MPSSSGQQKRRRSSITTTNKSSNSSKCDGSRGVDRKDWNEADGEEERAIKNNHTDKKRRRTELFEEDEDEDAIATVVVAEAAAAAATTTTIATTTTTTTTAAAAAAISTDGILKTQGGGSPSNKWNRTPVSLFIRTLSYLDNTTLMVLCLVCKQIRDIIWTGQGMETKLVRIFQLSLSKNHNFDSRFRARRFVSNMNQYFQNVTKTRILQGFQHWKVQNLEIFHTAEYIRNDEELDQLAQTIRMTGIVSLDMSSSLPMAFCYHTLHRVISFMVPNLQQLDLSRTTMDPDILEEFAARCPRLEIIRWNYNNDNYGIDADGCELQAMNNLKELYLDNWYFDFVDHPFDENGDVVDDDDDNNDNSVTVFEAMADIDNYPNIFLFCGLLVCNNPLERISIRNARCRYHSPEEIPQNVLMKFVRNVPATLVWFRSDLSPENIQILQSERPGIQLLN